MHDDSSYLSLLYTLGFALLIFFAWSQTSPGKNLLGLIMITLGCGFLLEAATLFGWPYVNAFDTMLSEIICSAQNHADKDCLLQMSERGSTPRILIASLLSVFLWGVIDILSVPVRHVISVVKKQQPA